MGRTACTEPQCMYRGDLYLLPFYIEITERSHMYVAFEARDVLRPYSHVPFPEPIALHQPAQSVTPS
jgi:hypothetical protein